ncbi:MAG TPA: UDP-N-acetylmuramoyl-L-alanine--D-glutamate ligase [Burkholderiales bacterium]|nr:UDP-N-acetylmuramoyl-L-alanine--D-glutamate ligase [Burkholderiales bacterium]
MDVRGKKVLVLGLGDTGLSMTRWLARRGAIVSAADTRAEPPHAAVVRRELPAVTLECGDFNSASLRAADLIAISPGIDRRTPAIAAAVAHGVPVTGDIELFAQALPQAVSRKPKIIAVTGTNGKSTVTRMAGDICIAAGHATVVAGNIGTPVLDALTDIEEGRSAPTAFVLELSSFQLETTASLDADAAAMLNVSEDHLDRYDGIDEYAAAKARVFNGHGAQIVNREDARSAAMAQLGRAVWSFGAGAPDSERAWGIAQHGGQPTFMRGAHALMPVADLPVAGLHNAANALAAGALCHAIGIADAPIVAALRAYQGLPHRVEKIAVIDGVTYYDDSKGTNVGSTVAALNGFAQSVVLIAGGEGKGQDFAPLRDPIARHARAVVLIGRDREQIARAIEASGVAVQRAATMDEAVQLARAASRPGDVVLLSPACASYDMFKNYGHRGDVFAAAVKKEVARGGR